ncbi:MAG: hypothetical protein H6Q42_1817 [Deltaproteobacteria bacterium]|nr:hypothetical protein [Deltaproteobacteria bacterium]
MIFYSTFSEELELKAALLCSNKAKLFNLFDGEGHSLKPDFISWGF